VGALRVLTSDVLLFCFWLLDRTPLQRKIEFIILKKILNNLPENIAYARTLSFMCDLSDGRAFAHAVEVQGVDDG
jgi:hypothetical protein